MSIRITRVVAVAGSLAAAACRACHRRSSSRGHLALSPPTLLLRGENLAAAKARLRAHDATLRPAYDALIRDADVALKAGPFSVTQKHRTPPSGDKHDYMSLAPYWWPDTTKRDGLPFIRRDGDVNPESRLDTDSPRFGQMSDAVEALESCLLLHRRGEIRRARRGVVADVVPRSWHAHEPESALRPGNSRRDGRQRDRHHRHAQHVEHRRRCPAAAERAAVDSRRTKARCASGVAAISRGCRRAFRGRRRRRRRTIMEPGTTHRPQPSRCSSATARSRADWSVRARNSGSARRSRPTAGSRRSFRAPGRSTTACSTSSRSRGWRNWDGMSA